MLDRKAHVQVLDQDVFVSVVGGAARTSPRVDLALALAIASSLRDRPVPHDLIAFGELGLTGEVRAVPRVAVRLAEARKLGFTRAMFPPQPARAARAGRARGLTLTGVRTLQRGVLAALSG